MRLDWTVGRRWSLVNSRLLNVADKQANTATMLLECSPSYGETIIAMSSTPRPLHLRLDSTSSTACVFFVWSSREFLKPAKKQSRVKIVHNLFVVVVVVIDCVLLLSKRTSLYRPMALKHTKVKKCGCLSRSFS